MSAEEALERPRGRPFLKGQSGNPQGRPKGARNRATLACQALLDGEGQALTRKAVELAKSGDIHALRLCLDRILPARRDRPISLNLRGVTTAADASAALGEVLEAVAKGEITPSEGQAVGALLDTQRKGVESAELEARIRALEATLQGRRNKP